MRFADRVAIVTGAASGIGLATACRLGSEGARVLVVDLEQDAAEGAAGKVRLAGAPDALGVACDVGEEAQVVAAADAAVARWGRLDVIVNNAGIMTFHPLEELDTKGWNEVLRVDLVGAFLFLREGFRRMKPGGAIVNVASVHARETEPNVAPYAAAKAAVLSLTRSGAIEGRAKGIRVNAVLPGAVDTPMLWSNPEVRSHVEKIDPAEIGKPEDVAAAIAFLASDEARFVQGAMLRVDGGRLDRL